MCESDLCEWIKKSHIRWDGKSIERVIKAFSEYVCAVDQEYLYNKTFLNEFIESFIESTQMLCKKRECMKQLLDYLEDYKEAINIDIDGAWIYEGRNNSITLSSSFDKRQVNTNKIKCQIRYLEIPSFVIAKDVSKEEIKEVANLFKSRLNN